jgi:hypothetical protein
MQGCSGLLDEEMYSQLAPDNFLNTEDGVKSVLSAAYATAANMNGNNSIYAALAQQEWTTDIMWQSGDGVARTAAQYVNFTWDASVDLLTGNWDPPYQTIRNANMLLESIDRLSIPEEQKAGYKAECRFLRAISYYKLYDLFGPVPLRKSSQDPLQLPRATGEEMRAFIESELQQVAAALPGPGKEAAYGRAHKAAAIGYLCKFYLNTKQWRKCADAAQTIMSMGYYTLFPEYEQLFKVENERNKEFIWVRPAKASADRSTSNSWMNTAFPDDFARDPRTGLTFSSAWRNWPNEFRMRDDFYNSFDPHDKRRNLIIATYINSKGKTVSLLNDNNTRSFKYWPDIAEGIEASHGNDIPEIRYADILLSRAEALNELSGPNAESVALINQVRKRAGLQDVLLAGFPAKEALRDHILKERGWELYSEGQRRTDLIRMNRFISGALERGKSNAKPFHVLFPIPQAVIDSDPSLVQNAGY